MSEDIAGAARWYRHERYDLGDKFTEVAYAFMQEIAARPETWRLVYRQYHRAFMRRFPYAIYYRVHNDEVVIALVFHTARNPATLRGILRSREKSS